MLPVALCYSFVKKKKAIEVGMGVTFKKWVAVGETLLYTSFTGNKQDDIM